MAGSNGIPAIVDGLVSGLTALRTSGTVRQRNGAAVGGGASGQSDNADGRPQRQLVNVEGQVLDRTAPRGTYVNILA